MEQLHSLQTTVRIHMAHLSYRHQVHANVQGDFLFDDKLVFEIGSASKTAIQRGRQENALIVADDIETGSPGQIPLWLFRMLN